MKIFIYTFLILIFFVLVFRCLSKGTKGGNFKFTIEKDSGDALLNRWYRLAKWNRTHFLKMNTEWSRDWKLLFSELNVAGVTQGRRENDFMLIGDREDFTVYLEREPDNPVDQNAIKVMGKATIGGVEMVRQLGYIPADTALQLKEEQELNARPHSVFLPYGGNRYGLRVNVLGRSKSYIKRNR